MQIHKRGTWMVADPSRELGAGVALWAFEVALLADGHVRVAEVDFGGGGIRAGEAHEAGEAYAADRGEWRAILDGTVTGPKWLVAHLEILRVQLNATLGEADRLFPE